MHAILKCVIGNRAYTLYFHMQLFLDISNILLGAVGGLVNTSGFFVTSVKGGLRNSPHDKIATFSSFFV